MSQNQTAFTIRRRNDDDLGACAEALIEVHRTDGYPVEGVADPRAWLQPDGLIQAWVADQPPVVGHVLLTEPRREDVVSIWTRHADNDGQAVAVLGRLFVVRAARHRSAGALLTRAAMTGAAEQGLRLLLDVMNKDTAAIRLYERLGWTRIGTAVHRYGNGQEILAYCYVAPTVETILREAQSA